MSATSFTARNKTKVIPALIAAAFLATSLACWIIPCRLAKGANGSPYMFGYIGDEYLYAQRIQPLVQGATATNVFNGVGDPGIQSPFFLEDFLRAIVTYSGINVVTFIWTWRILFPLVLAACFAWLADACIPARRFSRAYCRWALAAVLFPGLYCLYDLVTYFPPLQGFLNRVPTNIEYPLSIAIGCLYLQFLRCPGLYRGLALAGVSLCIVYLRPYLALPWSITLVPGVAWMLVARRVRLQTCLAMAAMLFLGVLPLLYIVKHNGASAAYNEFYTRYFDLPFAYKIHPRWMFFLAVGAVLALAAWKAARMGRPLLWGAAGAMAILPFICGFFSIANELIMFDRFGSFYLVAALCAVALALEKQISSWRGQSGNEKTRRLTALALCAGFVLATLLGLANFNYDFSKYPGGPCPSISEDLQYVGAYEWIAANTEPNALFLVDDGFDWSHLPGSPNEWDKLLRKFTSKDDLFQIVARRRRVYAERLSTCTISDADWQDLAVLHRGTFGYPLDAAPYFKALLRFRPSYILWRKTPAIPVSMVAAPVPRGFGADLEKKGCCRKVHGGSGDVFEIWKIDYEAISGNGL